MSLFHLNKFVAGNEDFADAHEPLNDGVKEVPNAQTVAASTKTGDVGTDTNSQGPAKVIPEKEDTDDATEKQFDTVKESAEKGAAETAPAKPAGEPSESKPAPFEKSKPAEGSEDTPVDSSDGATKAPPFVKKDDAEESEAKANEPKLEHDTAEATDEEIKKTENATKSLEKYSVNAGRFDIIGYPRRDQERLHNTIGFINRRAGKSAGVTKLSLESINEAVTTGKARIESLRKQAEIHAARKVSAENYGIVVDQAVAEGSMVVPEPTAHGNAPLDPLVAEQVTDFETDPLELPEVAEFAHIQEAVQTLQGAGVAIEQHLTILRSNKRISQQAAAVLQAGLEHIDQLCGLKVRATGMESYDTSPRAAMLTANISIESLTNRASEIGAKVLKWIKLLMEKAGQLWGKYQAGVAGITTKAEATKAAIDKLSGDPKSATIDIQTTPDMWKNGIFVGDHLDGDLMKCNEFLRQQYNYIRVDMVNKFIMVLKRPATDSILDELNDIVEDQKRDHLTASLELPGGHVLRKEGEFIKFLDNNEAKENPGKATIDVDLGDMKLQIKDTVKFLTLLGSDRVLNIMTKAQEDMSKALIEFRKGSGKDLEEEQRQAIQTFVINKMQEAYNMDEFFRTIKFLARQGSNTVAVLGAMANAW